MNSIKKLCVSVVFALSVTYLFSDKVLGYVSSFVKNESDILEVGVLEGNVPIFAVKEEREGYVSNITEYFIIYGKEKVGPFDSVMTPLNFLYDTKTLAYIATIDKKYYIFVGKEKAGPFDEVIPFIPFSTDGKTFAYIAKVDEKYYIFVDKEKMGAFDEVRWFSFSPDGKTFAYSAKVDKKWYIFIGKEKIGSFDEASYCNFSPNGKTLAYSAKVDKEWYIFVGKEKIGPFYNVGKHTFSPDGKTLAYITMFDGKSYLHVGKEKAVPFNGEMITVNFSDDGKVIEISSSFLSLSLSTKLFLIPKHTQAQYVATRLFISKMARLC